MKRITLRQEGYNYKKGVFIPYSTLLIISLLIIGYISHKPVLNILDNYSIYISIPLMIIIFIIISLCIKFIMTSEISMAMIIPNERVIDLVKKSKKPNQKSSYTFDLLGEDEYISLFTTCKYLEYYKSLLNSLNQLIESKYFENEKQELIKAYSLKEALKERIDILERVCTVLKENNV